MEANPTMDIEIAGHTDSDGSSSSNETLSDNRANAVYSYLLENGVAKERLTFKGYGEEKPVATNETEEGKALNRRVEFVIINIGE